MLRRACISGLSLLAAAAALAQPPLEYAREDPTRIRTAEACGECHVSEYEVWKRTPHATGFKELHRKESAEAIAGRMGFRLMKRDSACLGCHYTPTLQNDQLRAVSGVSCESCHGAGADWIDVHNDYGGKGTTHATESPEHRARRIARSVAAGMRRPTDLYDVASSCFGCHTVPNERLVNVGRHSIGSPGFELVAWSQGEIRHNFLESFKNGDGTVNAERPIERKRLMYAAGRALELEHALRGVAAATEKGVYLKAMQRRVRSALSEVRAIARRAELPEMDDIVGIVGGVDVGLGQRAALLEAAEAIGAAARRLLDGRDGTRLASLDPLVLGTEDAGDIEDQGPFEDPEIAVAEVAGTTAAASAASAEVAGTTSAEVAGTGAGSATTTAAPARSDAVPAVGEVKRRLRPRSSHATLDAGACSKCHGDQNAWWFEDPHYAAIEPFLEARRDNVRIARLYGISPAKMTRGDSLCMDCHGTVVSGREKREVQDGVSCQGCHGAAADFLEPHQEGDKSLGAARPGYVKALKLGMVELQDLATRAERCAGCHYVTDPRLISSGHPSGIDFDYVEGMRKIRHWQSPPATAPGLEAAFDVALASRGPVPQVRRARLASAATGGAATGAVTASTAGDSVTRPRTPRARPADSRPGVATSYTARSRGADASESPAAAAARDAAAASDAAALGLPPFPRIDDATPVEKALLLLKERLEQLYRAVRREEP